MKRTLLASLLSFALALVATPFVAQSSAYASHIHGSGSLTLPPQLEAGSHQSANGYWQASSCSTGGTVIPPPDLTSLAGATASSSNASYTLYSALQQIWSQYDSALSYYNNTTVPNWQTAENAYLAGTGPNPGPEPSGPAAPQLPQPSSVATSECPPPPNCGGNGLETVVAYPQSMNSPGQYSYTANFTDPFNSSITDTSSPIPISVANPEAYNQLYLTLQYYTWTGLDPSGMQLLNYVQTASQSQIDNGPAPTLSASGIHSACSNYDSVSTTKCMSKGICIPQVITKFGQNPKPPKCLTVPVGSPPGPGCGSPWVGLHIKYNVDKYFSQGTLVSAPCSSSNTDTACQATGGTNLPAYVNVPTCVWLQGDTQPTLTFSKAIAPTVANGMEKSIPGPWGPVTAFFYLHYSFTPGPIKVNWGDGTVTTATGTVGNDPYNGTLPSFNPGSGQWSSGSCTPGMFHRYTSVTKNSTASGGQACTGTIQCHIISVTQTFYVTAVVTWSNGFTEGQYYIPEAGNGIPGGCSSTGGVFNNCPEPVTWNTVPKQVMQIESLPYLP